MFPVHICWTAALFSYFENLSWIIFFIGVHFLNGDKITANSSPSWCINNISHLSRMYRFAECYCMLLYITVYYQDTVMVFQGWSWTYSVFQVLIGNLAFAVPKGYEFCFRKSEIVILGWKNGWTFGSQMVIFSNWAVIKIKIVMFFF